MFNIQELNALVALLSRVDLKGSEAMAVAQLQVKLASLIKQEAPVEPTTEVPTE
jgi:hypothetical protein